MSQLNLTWMADLKLESDLRAMGVVFEIRSILFSQLDLHTSRNNGARIGDPVIAHLVADYKVGMMNGDTFPRIVVHQGKAGFVILGGNQRCQAIQGLVSDGLVSKKLAIEVYVVDTTDKLLLEIIARAGNVGHGGRSGMEERLAHAVYSVRTLGMQQKDAAKIFMVADGTINHHIRGDKERDDWARQGVNVDTVPTSALLALGQVTDGSIKTKLGHLVKQHLPTTERVKHVVSQIKRARSRSGKLAGIKAFEKELADEAHRTGRHNRNGDKTRKVPRRPRRDRIIRDLTHLANFLESGMDGERFSSFADLQIASDLDEQTIRNLWSRINSSMVSILKRTKQ